MEMLKVVPFKVQILAPFYYHGVLVQGQPENGTGTHPGYLSDRALCFALAGTALGDTSIKRILRGHESMKEDLQNLPWRTSLGVQLNGRCLPSVFRAINMSREGKYDSTIQKNMSSGLFKGIFSTRDVCPDPNLFYYGLLVGHVDPFEVTKEEALIIRFGVGKTGVAKIYRDKEPDNKWYRLNCSTAELFEDSVDEYEFVLDNIRASRPMDQTIAKSHLEKWLK